MGGLFFVKKLTTRTVVYLGVLTALEIVLTRFLSINAWNIRIGFGFVPIAAAGMLFGPIPAAVMAALADVLGAVLFPTGPFFPGFTVTAALTGLSFGLCLYKKRSTVRVLIAVGVNQLVLGLLVNTYWISVLYGSPFLPLLTTRLIQCAVLVPVQLVVTLLMGRAADQYGGRLPL